MCQPLTVEPPAMAFGSGSLRTSCCCMSRRPLSDLSSAFCISIIPPAVTASAMTGSKIGWRAACR